MHTHQLIVLALLAGCAGYGTGRGPELNPGESGPPQVQLFVGATSLASPVRVTGSVLTDGPVAVEWVQLLGRRVTPLTTDFSSFEITFDDRSLEVAAHGGVVLLQPTVKMFLDPRPRALACAAAGLGDTDEEPTSTDTELDTDPALDTDPVLDTEPTDVDEQGALATLPDLGLAPLCRIDRPKSDVGPCSCVEFALDGQDPTLDDVDPTSLVDRVFEVELSSGRFSRPAQFEPIFRQLTVDYGLLLKVTAYDAAKQQADVLAAMSWRGRQVGDRPTFTLSGEHAMSLAENPRFAVQGAEIAIPLSDGASLPFHDVTIEGTLTSDGLRAVDVRVEGVVDAADLGGYGLGADTFCAVLGLDGVEDCGPCPTGESNSCFRVTVEGGVAEASEAEVVARPAEASP